MASVKGMTVLELLVVLIISAMLALIASPSYEAFLQRERHSKAVNGLQSIFMYARSEAVKREKAITVQFNAAVNRLDVLHNTEVLRSFALPAATTGISVSGITNINIGVTGRLTSGTPDPWHIADSKGFAAAKCISILISGQLTVSKGSCS